MAIIFNESSWPIVITDGIKTYLLNPLENSLTKFNTVKMEGYLLDGKTKVFFENKIISKIVCSGAISIGDTPEGALLIRDFDASILQKDVRNRSPMWLNQEAIKLMVMAGPYVRPPYGLLYFNMSWCCSQAGWNYFDIISTPTSLPSDDTRLSLSQHYDYLKNNPQHLQDIPEEKISIFFNLLQKFLDRLSVFEPFSTSNLNKLHTIIYRFYFLISDFLLLGDNFSDEYILLYEIFSAKSYRNNSVLTEEKLILRLLLLIVPAADLTANNFYTILKSLFYPVTINNQPILTLLEKSYSFYLGENPINNEIWEKWENYPKINATRGSETIQLAKIGATLGFTAKAFRFMQPRKQASNYPNLYERAIYKYGRGIPFYAVQYIIEQGILHETIKVYNINFQIKKIGNIYVMINGNEIELVTPYFDMSKKEIFKPKTKGKEVVEQSIALAQLVEDRHPNLSYQPLFMKRVAKQESKFGEDDLTYTKIVTEEGPYKGTLYCGGIWQINPVAYLETINKEEGPKSMIDNLKLSYQAIKEVLSDLDMPKNDWKKEVKYEDLLSPAYSCIAATILFALQSRYNAPKYNLTAQATFWKWVHNTMRGAGTFEEFKENNKEDQSISPTF